MFIFDTFTEQEEKISDFIIPYGSVFLHMLIFQHVNHIFPHQYPCTTTEAV